MRNNRGLAFPEGANPDVFRKNSRAVKKLLKNATKVKKSHKADSTGRFHTTSFESTADARDAAVLAKRDGAVVLVFTTPTPHRARISY